MWDKQQSQENAESGKLNGTHIEELVGREQEQETECREAVSKAALEVTLRVCTEGHRCLQSHTDPSFL